MSTQCPIALQINKLPKWWMARPLFKAVQAVRRALGIEDMRNMAVNILDLKPGESVLCLGCSLGENLELLRRKQVVIAAADENPQHLEAARAVVRENNWHNVHILNWPDERLPYPAGSFDAVLCIGGLTSAHNQAKLLEEAHRLLKEGGRMSVLDYNQTGCPCNLPWKALTCLAGHNLDKPWRRQTRRILNVAFEESVGHGTATLIYGTRK